MSSRCGISCAIAAIFALATVSTVAAAPPVIRSINAEVPTSVSLLSGRYGDGKLAGLVAIQILPREILIDLGIQPVAPNTVRIAGLVTGLPAGKTVLALARADYCGDGAAQTFARVDIPATGAFDVGVKVSDVSSIRSGVWLALFRDRNTTGSKPLACARVKPFARSGAIISPRDTASRQATGIAVLQRSKGPIAVHAILRASRTLPHVDGLVLEFMSRDCTKALLTPNALLLRALPLEGAPVARGLAVELMFDTIRASDSIVLAARVGTEVQPVACTKWELSEFDA